MAFDRERPELHFLKHFVFHTGAVVGGDCVHKPISTSLFCEVLCAVCEYVLVEEGRPAVIFLCACELVEVCLEFDFLISVHILSFCLNPISY